MEKIETKECFIASIDLLGAKDIIKKDEKDEHLNKINQIYQSWIKMGMRGYFERLKIKFFSDNTIIAIETDICKEADVLLEFVGYMAEHFLKCGYKPRGGICKGKIYIDDCFTWGEGLVKAYELESKEAIYPRIIVSEEIVNAISGRLKEQMLCVDEEDNKTYLNYLKGFGKQLKIFEIYQIRDKLLLEQEVSQLQLMKEKTQNEQEISDILRKIEKLNWLKKFLNMNEEMCEQ